MKEKRVDVYIALAGMYYVAFIGLGGTFLNEVVRSKPEMIVIVFCGTACPILFVFVHRAYKKAKSLTKRSKKWQQ